MDMGDGNFNPNSTDSVLAGILTELKTINETLSAMKESEDLRDRRITMLETSGSVLKAQASLISIAACALWTVGSWVVGVLLNKGH